jgi:hypothetical protein
MKIEIFNGNWSQSDVKSNPNKLFVFGDNNARVGKGGQAQIRDLSNTAGIRTKKGPSNKPAAFLTDIELDNNCKNIREDIIEIKTKYLSGNYDTIVLSSGGYGTGLAQLEKFAPKTFHFLNNLLEYNFYFENKSGKIKRVIPNHSEISGAKYISIDGKEFQSGVLSPPNNSFFRSNLLELGLNTYIDLISKYKKLAFTSTTSHSIGEIIILVHQNIYIVVRVTDSYRIEEISKKNWSVLEGFEDVIIQDYIGNETMYQNHIEYIGILDTNGKIEFNSDLFGNNTKIDSDPIIVGDKIYSKGIDKKTSRIIQLSDGKLSVDDIEPTPTKDIYQVLSKGSYYLVEYKNYLIWDTIKILLCSESRIL